MDSDIEKFEKNELEIVYDVQWKTPGNDDDKAKIIGIVDTPDTNLDWSTFKSYLIQNSGNMRFSNDDIRISYLDSDDDLVPIDSELEFRECLKFSRIRARRGHKILLKVSMVSNGGAKPKDSIKYAEELSAKQANPKLFCLKKKDINPKTILKKSVKVTESKETPPEWFEKYMTKFKAELVQEITSTVMNNMRTILNNGNGNGSANPMGVGNSQLNSGNTATKSHNNHPWHLMDKRKKKKKMPEEDSSDCTDGLQHWEDRMELLRHMQKVNKREKKFEKKLDAKLEKLESKTKKIMEKKHCLWNPKKNISTAQVVPPSFLSVPPARIPCEFVMDAAPVDDYNYVPHVLCGEVVSYVWKVVNNGQLPWTDETELRFAWGSKSLVPIEISVKCPLLKPGEIGKIKVSFRALYNPGNFESYWHFHHQGRRFGHWVGCVIIVDPPPARPRTPSPEAQIIKAFNFIQLDQPPLPVDLTMKCQQNYSTTDDMKIYNIETKPEVIPKQETVQEEFKQETKNDTSLDSNRCVVDGELEEFPRLESYSDISKPELNFGADTFPDLIQGNDDQLNLPDLNNMAHHSRNGVMADLLNIKEESFVGNDEKNNLSGIDKLAVTNDDKKNNEELSTEADPGEYLSGSDTDNISIISTTVSVDLDDTEQSDDFVVVPMPTCVNCDHPSVPVNVPISVEIPHTPPESEISSGHRMQGHPQSDDNNNSQPPSTVCAPVLHSSEECNTFYEALENPSQSEPNQKEELKMSDDENTVYVRDESGKSIPVAKVIRTEQKSTDNKSEQRGSFGAGVGIAYSIYGDPNFGHGPNGPRFPFSSGSDSPTSPPHCHNPGGPCNFRPRYETPIFSPSTNNPCCSSHEGNKKQKCKSSQNVDNVLKQKMKKYLVQQCKERKQQQQYLQQHFQQKIQRHFQYLREHHQQQQQNPQNQQNQHHQQQQNPQNQQQQQPEQCSNWTPPKIYPSDALYQQQEMMKSRNPQAYRNIHTEQPRPRKYPFVFGVQENSPTNATSAPSNSRRNVPENREESPVSAAVQILPDSLVSGAVHVASSAINTAKSVIEMLRPRQEESNPMSQQQWTNSSSLETSLRALDEMGFTNRELNVLLLTKHDNDVSKVIFELIQ